MTGRTFLQIWALQDPIGRRSVILLTAFPVVFGIFLVALVGFLEGGPFNVWILIKTTVLFVLMVASYVLAGGTQQG